MSEPTEWDPLHVRRTHEPSSPLAETQLARPLPPRRVADRAQAWVMWFGIPRMLALGVTVLLVGGGGYWLLQAPPPPVEASLPFAATTTTADTTKSTAPGSGDSAGDPTMGATTVPVPSPPLPSFVHVAGAVVAPGVYQLPPGARVIDAVDAAGGPGPEAALDGLNLAASVADGQRVYVPVVGEVDLAAVDNGPATQMAVGVGSATSSGTEGVPIDVNRATAAELETLPGVGPATAAAIIDDRDRNGPFAAVDDLDRVSGIGPATLDALRDLVTV